MVAVPRFPTTWCCWASGPASVRLELFSKACVGLIKGLPITLLPMFYLLSSLKTKSWGRGYGKCKYLTKPSVGHTSVLYFLHFINIFEIFLIKKNFKSPLSSLDILESAGKVSLFQHQILDQYCSIECLKCG